ncbi:MAG: hypothetical protein ACHQ16_05595, partial [Candidatus Lutacidiplasmatales archaeon]
PPFHGTHHFASTVQKTGCGATASLVVPPAFNLTSGIGRAFGKSSVTACGPTGSYDYASTEETTGFDSFVIVVHAPTPQNFSLTGHFNVSWNLSATPMNPSGGPSAWATAAFDLFGRLYDVTNASVVISFAVYTLGITTNGTATGNVSSYFANGFAYTATNFTKLTVAGHHYIFQFYSETVETSYAPAGTGTSASARINLATGGHLVKLNQWSLS